MSASLTPMTAFWPTQRGPTVFAPVDRVDPDHRLHVHVDPQRPMAWTRRDVKRWIERIVGRGITVVLSVGHKHTVLRADLPNVRRRRRGDYETRELAHRRR